MNLPILLCLWIIQGSIAAFCAKRRGRNPYLWFAIGCFFGLFGIFAVFFLKSAKKGVDIAKILPAEPVQKTLPYRLWYYLDQNAQQHGPISTTALEAACEEGKIFPTTYVWHEGMENWKSWQEICQEHGVTLGSTLAIPTA